MTKYFTSMTELLKHADFFVNKEGYWNRIISYDPDSDELLYEKELTTYTLKNASEVISTKDLLVTETPQLFKATMKTLYAMLAFLCLVVIMCIPVYWFFNPIMTEMQVFKATWWLFFPSIVLMFFCISRFKILKPPSR